MSNQTNTIGDMPDQEAYLSTGLELQKKKHWREAVAHYQQAINLIPNCAQAHYQLGQIWTRLGRIDIAIGFHKTAYKLTPESYPYSIALASAMKLQGMHADAITIYTHCIELKPHNPDAYHLLGDLLMMKQRFTEAVTSYQGAVDLKTENPWSYHNLGKALSKLSRPHDAIPYLRRATQLKPDLAFFFRSLGEAQQAGEFTAEALAAYSRAIELEPKNAEFHCALGLFFNSTDRWSEAIPCFIEALKCNPGYLHSYRPLGSALHKNGDISDDDLQRFDVLVIPGQIVESLFETANIQSVGLDSSEVKCLASEAGENVALTPKSITSLVSEPGEYGKEKFLEKIAVPPAHLLEVKNARAWADGVNSAVMTASGKLIDPVSTRNSKLTASISEIHPVKKIEGLTAFLSHKSAYGNNYFHWLFNDLARFHLFELAGIELSSIDAFVFAHTRKDFYQSALDALGIPASKIIQSINDPHISADRMLIPSATHTVGSSKWACNFLRKHFLDSESNNDTINVSERIYISRQGATYRRIRNENELIPLLSEHGFEFIKLEAHSIQQQAKILSRAKVVISSHGAGLTNLVFCNPGTKVIEMFPRSVMDTINLIGPYPVIAHQCQLDHYHFFGDDIDNCESTPQLRKDFTVNVNQLKSMLNRLC